MVLISSSRTVSVRGNIPRHGKQLSGLSAPAGDDEGGDGDGDGARPADTVFFILNSGPCGIIKIRDPLFTVPQTKVK